MEMSDDNNFINFIENTIVYAICLNPRYPLPSKIKPSSQKKILITELSSGLSAIYECLVFMAGGGTTEVYLK